eukprot:jgi/Chlat1/3956/Chrsp26S04036
MAAPMASTHAQSVLLQHHTLSVSSPSHAVGRQSRRGRPATRRPTSMVASPPRPEQATQKPGGFSGLGQKLPDDQRLKIAIVGSGLAGMSTAVELLDAGHDVELYESRPFIGGKVASFQDKDGNHIEMGLHVFFGCYFNLFRLMTKCGVLDNLLLKEHTHTFVNKGGDVRDLDFRFIVGAPFHGLKAFFTTPQLTALDKAQNALALGLSPVVRALVDPDGAMRDIRELDKASGFLLLSLRMQHRILCITHCWCVSFTDWFKSHGGSQGSIDRMWDPIAYALGFIDCDNISARCMLTIFQFFATKTDASKLRMLAGSPADYLLAPISKYITERGGTFHIRTGCREVLYDEDAAGVPRVTGLSVSKATEKSVIKADAYVAACDVPGIKRLLPQAWRKIDMFDRLHVLEGVPVVTVQLRYDGWVTEMQDTDGMRDTSKARGLDNLLYSADAHFSCFADLALASPKSYYKEGEGSLMQLVLTPGDPYMGTPNEEIAEIVDKQVKDLFPSARDLKVTWHSVVKIAQSLYREAPGMASCCCDVYRPDQATPVPNFFLAGSYTTQDYIDSMEGATLSGRQCADAVLKAAPALLAARQS